MPFYKTLYYFRPSAKILLIALKISGLARPILPSSPSSRLVLTPIPSSAGTLSCLLFLEFTELVPTLRPLLFLSLIPGILCP